MHDMNSLQALTLIKEDQLYLMPVMIFQTLLFVCFYMIPLMTIIFYESENDKIHFLFLICLVAMSWFMSIEICRMVK